MSEESSSQSPPIVMVDPDLQPGEEGVHMTIKHLPKSDGGTYASFTVEDPVGRRKYQESIPTKHERRENLDNVPTQCSYSECGKAMRRAEIKVCSRCKNARYCSQACQKSHWPTHKTACGKGAPRDLATKLAERALAVSTVMEQVISHAILTLELLADVSNASKYFVHVKCTTGASDLNEYMRRMMAGEGKDPNAEQVLVFESIERVAAEDAPERTRKVDREGRAKYKGSLPMITFYFTSEDGGQDGSVCSSIVIPDWQMRHMASNPSVQMKSAMFGIITKVLTRTSILEIVNNTMRNDKTNQLRLRGYLNKP